jgi:hypothetical protein
MTEQGGALRFQGFLLMQRLIAAAVALLMPGLAMAETCRGPQDLGQPAAEVPVIADEFRRVAGGLGCVLAADNPAARVVRPLPYLPCLRIGPIGLGDKLEAVEAILGKPDQIKSLDVVTAARVYFIRQPDEPYPYYVVTFRNGKAVALQLRGRALGLPQTFSSLALGDPAQKVLDVLGLPSRHCSDDRGVESWSYPPYPFAIDLIDGAVVGVKMTLPLVRGE